MSILLYLSAILFLIAFPEDTAGTALQAMKLWANSLVPVLFPYMIFSRLLCENLNTLHFPAFSTAAMLGMLGGSPSGAAAVVSASHSLSERNLFSLCALTGTISPMFILGSIKNWIDIPDLTHRLLLCHWLGAIVCAWIVWLIHRGKQEHILSKATETLRIASDPIKQSIDAVFQIGGCIIIYSVLAGMLGKILHAFPTTLSLCHALLEISGGVHAICQSILPSEAKAIMIAATLGFGGFSVLSQNYSMLQVLGISMRKLVLFAIFRAAISAMLMACMIVFLPIS